jgi:ATP-dependent Lhr-like helicase
MPPGALAEVALDSAAGAVMECLRQQGASFVVDISRTTALAPGAVRAALWQLLRLGMVTNDRFDAIRRGELPAQSASRSPGLLRRGNSRGAPASPEGRWSLLPWGSPSAEVHAVLSASLLLHRHGIAARELALLDARMPSWRVLYEVLSRMELSGEVRRGYLVEGLSGAQFALPEAARLLQETALPSINAPAVLLHSLDPANLYGSGAPLDIPLLEGGTRPLLRRQGNWLVLCAGRPILLIEHQGSRITALPGASVDQLVMAVARLPSLLRLDRSLAGRHKLTVSEWNGQPVIGSAGQPLLEQLGFVRDYQDMTLYSGWTLPQQ